MLDLNLVGNKFICMTQIGDGTAKVEGVTFLVAQIKAENVVRGCGAPGSINAKQSRALLFPWNLSGRLTVPEIRSAMKITLYYATGKEVVSNQGKARIHKALHDCGFGVMGLHDVSLLLGTWGTLNCPMRHHVKPRTLPYSHVATTPGSNSSLRDFLPLTSHSAYTSIFSLAPYSQQSLRTEYSHWQTVEHGQACPLDLVRVLNLKKEHGT
jgi:hypothetical protein